MQTDFARLYKHLGVDQDCSLDAFKHACRRRINELHPDRRAVDAATAPIAIDEVIALYSRAVRFHRRHGRLPGAAPAARRVNLPRLSTHRMDGPALSAQDDVAAGSGRRAGLLALLLLCLGIAALALWASDDSAPAVDTTSLVTQRDASVVATSPARPTHLRIGMDVATVRAIQGEPIRSGSGLWEYGPSWLRIERNRLVDWHSSSMYPLEVMSDEPPPRVTQAP